MSDESDRAAAALVVPQPVANDLVRARWLLEHARRLTADRSLPGRHLALIALDGAVEYALWMVAHATDAEIKGGERPNYAQLTDGVAARLTELGRSWTREGRTGVDQLRRARNPAQHAGVAVDADQLDGWAAAAEAYVDRLLEAAFGIDLAAAQLALAVRDDILRRRLQQAERAIDAGDGEVGFSLSWIAFEEALTSWRETRHEVPAAWLMPPSPLMPGPQDELRRELGELQELIDVAPFTADLGDYLILRRTRREQEQTGWTPEMGDARRALRFAAGWIVRFEVAMTGYPSERWARYHDAVEPPTVGGDVPSIRSVSAVAVLTSAGNRRWLVRAQLADVPERGRGDWGLDFVAHLGDALRRHGGRSESIQRVAGAWRSGHVSIELLPDVDPDVVRAALENAVAGAHAGYEDRRERADELEQRRSAAERAWGELLAAQTDGLMRLHAISVDQRADGTHLIAHLELDDATDVELLSAAELLRSRGGSLANAGARDGRIDVEAIELSGDAGRQVAEGLASAATELRRRRSTRAAEDERFRAFAARMSEGWPEGG